MVSTWRPQRNPISPPAPPPPGALYSLRQTRGPDAETGGQGVFPAEEGCPRCAQGCGGAGARQN
eukprot:8895250-Alexandrium_andersonii.AAC.1